MSTAVELHDTSVCHAVVNKDDLIERFLPLVRNVVDQMKQNLPPHVEAEELCSIGVTGLIAAAHKYDPAQGGAFPSYAAMRIRGAVLDELRRRDWCPRRVRARIRSRKVAINDIEQKLGRAVTDGEICSALGITPKEYRKWVEESTPVTFLAIDQVTDVEDGRASNLHELLADVNDHTGRETLEDAELLQLLHRGIFELHDMPREVLKMYYFKRMKGALIAEMLGLTESRISQIRAQAILELRTWIKRALKK